MDATCSFCRNRRAEFKCRQCMTPVCDECAFKIDLGAFCSRRCANQFRDFHRARGRSSSGPRISITRLILLIVVAGTIAVLVAWWQGWLPRSWTSKLNEQVGTVREKVEEEADDLTAEPKETPTKTGGSGN